MATVMHSDLYVSNIESERRSNTLNVVAPLAVKNVTHLEVAEARFDISAERIVKPGNDTLVVKRKMSPVLKTLNTSVYESITAVNGKPVSFELRGRPIVNLAELNDTLLNFTSNLLGTIRFGFVSVGGSQLSLSEYLICEHEFDYVQYSVDVRHPTKGTYMFDSFQGKGGKLIHSDWFESTTNEVIVVEIHTIKYAFDAQVGLDTGVGPDDMPVHDNQKRQKLLMDLNASVQAWPFGGKLVWQQQSQIFSPGPNSNIYQTPFQVVCVNRDATDATVTQTNLVHAVDFELEFTTAAPAGAGVPGGPRGAVESPPNNPGVSLWVWRILNERYGSTGTAGMIDVRTPTYTPGRTYRFQSLFREVEFMYDTAIPPTPVIIAESSLNDYLKTETREYQSNIVLRMRYTPLKSTTNTFFTTWGHDLLVTNFTQINDGTLPYYPFINSLTHRWPANVTFTQMLEYVNQYTNVYMLNNKLTYKINNNTYKDIRTGQMYYVYNQPQLSEINTGAINTFKDGLAAYLSGSYAQAIRPRANSLQPITFDSQFYYTLRQFRTNSYQKLNLKIDPKFMTYGCAKVMGVESFYDRSKPTSVEIPPEGLKLQFNIDQYVYYVTIAEQNLHTGSFQFELVETFTKRLDPLYYNTTDIVSFLASLEHFMQTHIDTEIDIKLDEYTNAITFKSLSDASFEIDLARTTLPLKLIGIPQNQKGTATFSKLAPYLCPNVPIMPDLNYIFLKITPFDASLTTTHEQRFGVVNVAASFAFPITQTTKRNVIIGVATAQANRFLVALGRTCNITQFGITVVDREGNALNDTQFECIVRCHQKRQ